MAWKQKAKELYKRYGAPAKFAAKLVLGTVVPGSSEVVELIEKALDCAHETTKDNLDARARTAQRPRPWAVFRRMPGGSTTCTATCGNGARIGSAPLRHSMLSIPRATAPARIVCCVEAPGLTVQGAAVLRIVSGARRAT
jgi:hypothetical protein